MGRIGRLFQKFRPAAGSPEPPQERTSARWVVAGLGNPEKRWARSRHNIGFMVVDRIAAARSGSVEQKKFKGLYGEIKCGDQRVLLIKPQTYYNGSGESVGPIVSYFDVPTERLIVVHDELDLEAGRIQLKQGGGDAGNRGIKSIIESLGTGDFVRIRIGIAHPPGVMDTKDYILQPISEVDFKTLGPAIARAAEAVEAIITEGVSAAMNRFNQRV